MTSTKPAPVHPRSRKQAPRATPHATLARAKPGDKLRACVDLAALYASLWGRKYKPGPGSEKHVEFTFTVDGLALHASHTVMLGKDATCEEDGSRVPGFIRVAFSRSGEIIVQIARNEHGEPVAGGGILNYWLGGGGPLVSVEIVAALTAEGTED